MSSNKSIRNKHQPPSSSPKISLCDQVNTKVESKSKSKPRPLLTKECLIPNPNVIPNIRLWRIMSLAVTIGTIGMAANVFYEKYHESLEDDERLNERHFVKYNYMYRREKKFPWDKEGTGRSLFHNPKINALPGGYETIE